MTFPPARVEASEGNPTREGRTGDLHWRTAVELFAVSMVVGCQVAQLPCSLLCSSVGGGESLPAFDSFD